MFWRKVVATFSRFVPTRQIWPGLQHVTSATLPTKYSRDMLSRKLRSSALPLAPWNALDRPAVVAAEDIN